MLRLSTKKQLSNSIRCSSEATYVPKAQLRMEVEYGSFQNNVWQCICSNTYVKMRYIATFRKQAWQEYPNRKECVAVICLYTLSFERAYQAPLCICIL
jgi:hypothetical protein